MSRNREIRAASLARPLPPSLSAATSVERALSTLATRRSGAVVVSGRAGPLGGLTRAGLEHAVRLGLARCRLSDLLVGELRRVASNASLARVLEELRAGPAPFLLVGSSAGKREAYIERASLAGHLALGEAWKTRPIRTALRSTLTPAGRAALKQLGRTARESGAQACLVGGVVRDMLLGRPTGDLDVVLEGELSEVLGEFGVNWRVHSRFLTATVELSDGTRIDLARARTERYERPAALPDCAPCSLERDIERRDFSVNTLALSLDPRRFGAVLDLFGGLRDLEGRRIRALHGLSFIEDPTRAFRAVRLAARLGFTIEPHTCRLIEVALEQQVFGRLSPARLRREVEMLMGAPEFPTAIRLAARLGLLGALHADLRPVAGTAGRLDRAAVEIAWYVGLDRAEPFDPWLVPLGLLLADRAPAATRQLLDRLSPGRVARRVLEGSSHAVVELFERLSGPPGPAPSAVYRACRDLRVETLLMASASTRRVGVRRMIRHHLGFQRDTALEIDGRDLLRAGVAAGRAIAAGLEAALAAKLDGEAPGAREQLQRALSAATDHGRPA